MRYLFNYLVCDNPMCLEGVRAARRFFRTGGETGRAVNVTIFAILGVIYLWLLLSILRYREDVSEALIYIELAFMTLLVPGSLFGAVSGEREKLTWDSLIMTKLAPAQIIAGKLLWRLCIVVGLMGLFLVPLMLCKYGLGLWCSGDTCRGNAGSGSIGFRPADIANAQMLIFAWSLLLATLSFFVSTKSKRPVTSLSIITIAILAFVALLPILILMFNSEGAIWHAGDLAFSHIFGSFLIGVNPVTALVMFENHNDPNVGSDMWFTIGLFRAAPAIYGVGALLLLIATHKSLRGLEVPRRTIG